MKKINVTLDMMLVKRRIKSKELAKAIGITEQALSKLKNNHARGVRFATLEKICNYLDCEPKDILELEQINTDI